MSKLDLLVLMTLSLGYDIVIEDGAHNHFPLGININLICELCGLRVI